MKCPLFIGSRKFLGEDIMHLDTDCLKEECAWWHHGLNCCEVMVFTSALEALADVAEELKDKMPHVGYRTK